MVVNGKFLWQKINPLKYVQLKTDLTPIASQPWLIQWNAVDWTIDVWLLNGSILQVGQETMFYGKASGNILNGDNVQFAWVQWDHILMKRAVVSEIEANPHFFIGVATNNIANGSMWYATWFGKVNGVYTKSPANNDTQDWLAWDILYMNMTTGYLTKTKPTVPKRNIIVCVVIKAQTGASESGVLMVRPSIGIKLEDLDDVNGTTPVEWSFPVWNYTSKYFDFTAKIGDYLKIDQTTSQTTVGRFAFPNIAVDTNTLYTDSVNHRVGIGTTNPVKPLEVLKGVTGQNSLLKLTNSFGSANNTADIDFRVGGTDSTVNSRIATVRTDRATALDSDLVFSLTSNSALVERMRIKDNGNVGIGTTNPVETLQVSGTIGAGNNLNTNGGSTVMGELRSYQANTNPLYLSLKTDIGKSGLFRSNAGFFNYYDTTNGNTVLDVPFANSSLLFNTQGTTRATILSNGNVGIGTTNPGQKFDITNTGASATSFGFQVVGDNGSTGGSRAGFKLVDTTSTSGAYSFISRYSGFEMNQEFGPSYSNLFRLNGSNGNLSILGSITSSGTGNNSFVGSVGIGTSAPTNRLDVRGTTTNDSIRSAIGFDIYQVPDPTSPTGVVSAGGSVDTGAHWYGVTYVTALGETHIKFSASQITTTAGNNTVTLTIPVSTDPRVIARKIYRTRAGYALYQDSLLATVANNTDTTYVDTASDASLPSLQGAAYFRMNTTSKNITVNGTPAMALDLMGTIIGFQAGNINATGGRTTIVGKNAGANLTTATDSNLFGENAGNKLTTGNQNNLFGYNAGLYLTTGSGNTALGHDSLLYAGTSSSNNTTIGYFAGAGVDGSSLYSNNTLIGYNAGRFTTTGNSNSTLGSYSLYNTSTGNSNVALGYYSLFSNTTGSNNSAIGLGSLSSNISGTNISALGYNAGRYIANGITAKTYGNDSIYIGSNSKALTDGTNSEIVIGYNAIGKGSNTAIIGNTSLTALYVSGQVIPATLTSNPTWIEWWIYFNTTDKHFYWYNGTDWKQLDN